MLTSKQRAFLKSKANKIKPTFQIGKDGIGENMIRDLLFYLDKHELMKVSILNNSPVEIEDIKDSLSSTEIEVVDKIGNVVILYMKGKKAKDKIVLPN